MPIVGNLSEFPLPEVLLLIGSRTGRLRLLDVPEFGMIDIDFAEGEAQGMRMGSGVYTEAEEMIDKLSAVVQAQGGMFEFRIQTVAPVPRQRPLMTNQLVMALVCHVDEQMARQQEMAPSHYWYTLESPEPDIWIEPELDSFLQATRQFLASGVHADDLAQKLNLDVSVVQRNLTNLRLLGVVKMVDGVEVVQLEEVSVGEEISRKSNDFIRASRAASEIIRISGKLPRP